jgi:photosystem II stability/assembly factor-like uncharacterized protein
MADAYGKLELSFIPNQGQSDQQVKFLSHGPGYDLFLTSTEAVLSLRKPGAGPTDKFKQPTTDQQPQILSVLKLQMLGANQRTQMEGREELRGKVNYFTGNQPDKWLVNVPTYRKVIYRDIYPGIDLVYYGNQRELEYDFIVQPGADPATIRFRVEGADAISVDAKGDLRLRLKDGEVLLRKPFIYQLTDQGSRDEIPGQYEIKGKEIGIKVRKYDSTKTLIVDPILSYSTLLGAGGNEQGHDIDVDAQGNAYIAGVADSGAFPTTPGALQTTSTSSGAFVTKLDPTGSSLIYSTYLSGSSGSTATGIAVDSSGNAYVTGSTMSADFPSVNAIRGASNFLKSVDGGASWVGRNFSPPRNISAIAINPQLPSTMYAGTSGGGVYKSIDSGNTWTRLSTGVTLVAALVIDPVTPSTIYAATNAPSFGVIKSIDGGTSWVPLTGPTGTGLIYRLAIDPISPSTLYLGSNGGLFKTTNGGTNWGRLNAFPSTAYTIAIDPISPTTVYAGSGSILKSPDGGVSWSNASAGLPTNSGISVIVDPSNPTTLYAGTNNGIYKSINGGGNWSSSNSGMGNSEILSLALSPTSPAIIYAGTSNGKIFKTTNGGNSWSPSYSTIPSLRMIALAIDPVTASNVYAGTSATNGIDLEAFLAKLNDTGSSLIFSTFLGGTGIDAAFSIALDSSGNAYVTGATTSTDFLVANAFQASPGGGNDAFVLKMNSSGDTLLYSSYLGGSDGESGHGIAVDGGGNAYVTGSTRSANFPTMNAFQSTIGSSFSTDAFVTKISNAGALVYSTYLGGNDTDTGYGIATDSSGNAHITGVTTSSNFPTANPLQSTNGGSVGDAFVTKLNSTGSGLLYSTYLGGSNIDLGRGIAVDPAGNTYVTGYTGSPGFPLTPGSLRTKSPFYKSTEAAASWSNLNYGLGSASIVSLAVNPLQPSTIYAGTQSGVFKSTNGGRTWAAINNGLNNLWVVQVVVDPVTPSRVYAATSSLGGSFQNPGVYRSTDSGNSWTLVKTGMTNTSLLSLAIDPVTPTNLYAGTYGGPIYRTNNGGDNWTPSTNFTLGFAAWLAVDPHTPSNIYAAANSSGGGIHKSVDGGANWQVVHPGVSATFVGVSPLVPGTVYASTGPGGLVKSVDSGANWTVARAQSSFSKVVFDPVSSAVLYLLSTSEGVLKSTNSGQTWIPMNNGLKPATATSMAINSLNPATLYLAGASTSDNDAFVTKINPGGTALVYSTLLGSLPGSGDSLNLNDEGWALAVDSAGNAYITGASRSPDFPVTATAYQPFNRGFTDAFIAKLSASHIISGQILDGASAPVGGAEVYLNDGTSLIKTTTESDGSYQFTNLREGGSFVITASKPQFTMSPPSHTFNNLNSNQTANFTASSTGGPFYTLGGQVTENGVGRAGVTVTLSGSQPGLRTTDSNGNYSFTLAGGGNYTVTPSAVGFAFSPPNQSVNNLSSNQTVNFAANRQNFVVTNVNNHGTGSLRQAILDANASAGLDTIVFNIGSGVQTINLSIALPEITDPVVIDATTQPGFVGAPLIELNGAEAGSGAIGFKIASGGTTIRGFVINRFKNAGIEMRTGGNNVVQGNYIGIDPTGTTARGNHSGILFINSSNNTFGGLTPAARNVISAQSFYGISGSGSNNLIQGNFIGTNAAGTAALANGINGIELFSSFAGGTTNNVIGGTASGAGNLISGNQTGIRLNSTSALIQGNRIGTDVTGTLAVPNGVGVNASNFGATPLETIIGGIVPGARNVISGNQGDGVWAGGGVKVQGNFIGTDVTGTFAVGNSGNGVLAGNGALIGGTTPEARNIVSGNGGPGGFANISLGSNSSGSQAIVQGNYIGTDVTGNVALNNPQAGINISSANNIIGGLTPGAQNIISGNQVGIQIGGNISPGSAVGNTVQRNLIGLNAAGTLPLPNTIAGIRISDSNNTVGGSAAAGNRINFNGGAGIQVSFGTGNSIRGNSVFSNAGLGIDLSPDGITANDPSDPDTGANNRQNFPVLSSVTSNGSTTIVGSLNSKPGTAFVIDFYVNTACDDSGSGEGAQFFDSTNVTTDANGNASINFTSTQALPAGKVLVATATDPTGNTSEFSACDATTLTGSVQFSAAKNDVLEDVGNAVVKVLRVGGNKGTLSINYTTADGTATAGSDYTATSGTLVFADGETSKTLLIPIANDAVSETNETVRLSLTATDLETLGGYPVTTIVIHENNTPLQLAGPIMDVVEGNSGSTVGVVPIYLSAQTSRNVSVNYSTVGFTATSGVDFTPVSGTLNFAPGETVKNISVSITGDMRDEFNEDFGIALTDAVHATVILAPIIFILDDDPLPSISITDIMVNEGNSGTTGAVFNVSLSAPSGKSVSVQFNTANGTATSGSDYTATSGLVSFTPGQTSKTITVLVNGDTTVEPNETFLVNLFSPSAATISKAQGVATILDDEGQIPLQVILEPGSGQAAGVDSLLFVRDPFTVLNRAQWFNLSDPNTKVLVFLRNLQLSQGEPASVVEINLVSGSFTATFAAEDVRALPNTDLTQVTFRLPNNLPAGICVVSVKVHGQSSNTGTILIGQ